MIVSGFSGIRIAGKNAALALMVTTALSACTSVEYAEKPEIETPKIARAQPLATPPAEGTTATLAQQTGVAALPTTSTQVAATTAPLTQTTNGQMAFVQPQAAAAASAALTKQAAPSALATSPAPAVASASTVAVAPVANATQIALASVPRSTEKPTVIPVKADPPWVKAGRVHAASADATATNSNTQIFPEMPLPYEVTEMRSVIPVPKPGGTMLAYAGGPANAAFSAINASVSPSASASLLYPSSAMGKPELTGLIDKYATLYGVPKDLVHRVVHRESRYNPGAYSKGNFGLMQIRHATARSLGFQGPASGLLDAETNLKYAVKYLKGAWTVADKDKDAAVRLYAKGYYYEAKRKGLLHVMQ